MTHQEAEALARDRLGFLAGTYEPSGNRDWNELAEAAGWALAGDPRAIAVFRRVFEVPGFAVSASGMEVGYAAIGLGVLGDRAAIGWLAGRSMPFNGIDDALAAARVLLGDAAG